jgi:hypothetical protein
MSSIETDRDALLRAFFHERLVPAAERLREAGVRPFPLEPDPEAETYYRRREDDGDYIESLEPGALAERLKRLWADEPEMLALVDPLLELASRLGERAEEPAEVSPFVYAMF